MWTFGTFGWNDVTLMLISIVGITLVLILDHLTFRRKQLIIYIVFISIAIIAALASTIIRPDSIGTLITRSIILEAVSIYFLRKGDESR